MISLEGLDELGETNQPLQGAHNLYHHIHSSEFLAGLRYSQAHQTQYWQTGAELAWQAVLVLPFSAEQQTQNISKFAVRFRSLSVFLGDEAVCLRFREGSSA